MWAAPVMIACCGCAEFRHQLDTAVAVLELVPGVVFAEVSEEQKVHLEKERETRKDQHDSFMKEIANTKVLYHCPSLPPPPLSLSPSLSPLSPHYPLLHFILLLSLYIHYRNLMRSLFVLL